MVDVPSREEFESLRARVKAIEDLITQVKNFVCGSVSQSRSVMYLYLVVLQEEYRNIFPLSSPILFLNARAFSCAVHRATLDTS